MLRPKPTMISLSMKDVTEHFESVDRKAAKARAEGTVNSSSMRQPLGALRSESIPAMTDEPRVIYLSERNARIQGINPVPISTDMLHAFDRLTIRSRGSAESSNQTTRARSHQRITQEATENRITTTDADDDSVTTDFLESDLDDTWEPSSNEEDHDSMMTEVPGASPISRVSRPSLEYRDTSFEGSSRDDSSFGTMDLSPNITIRKQRKPSSRLTIRVPEDASTPPATAPEVAQNSQVERFRGRHQPIARSPLFRSIDPSQTPGRPTTIGLAPRLTSPGTPSTLFSQPPIRSHRAYRHRELTYSYEESENPNGGDAEVWEDNTAGPPPMDDDDYYDEEGEEYDEEEPEEEEESRDGNAHEERHDEENEAGELSNMFHREASLRYRELSHHDSSTTDDVDDGLPSSPPMHINNPGGVDGNMSRSSRTLMQNLQSASASIASGSRTASVLPSSPSLQLPPPFSAFPRRVSDNNALPASPPVPSSDDDRGRGRTRFPRLGDRERPWSLEAHAGDSPTSSTSPYDISQQDGSPGSNESSNDTDSTSTLAITLRLGMDIPYTDNGASDYRSRSPLTSYSHRHRGTSPKRAQGTATVPPSPPPLPVSTRDGVPMPLPVPPGHSSPSANRFFRQNASPARNTAPPISQSTGPAYTQAVHDVISSIINSDDGSTRTQPCTRPSPSRGNTSPARTTGPSATAATPPRPFPGLFLPSVASASLSPSAPASALRALTTTPGTSLPERMPWASRPYVEDRSLPTLPMHGLPPRTPGGSRIRVYDDRIAPELQPQTPEDLPESRHMSRYHPSYTAPIPQDNTPREYPNDQDYTRSESRVRRGRGARSDSPSGMRGEGTEGLFGGRENGDNELLYQRGQEAVRRRLFVEEQEMRGFPRRVTGRWGNEWVWVGDEGRVGRSEGGVRRGGSGGDL